MDFGGGPLVSQGGDDAFVVKLDAGGQHLWSKSFGDASGQKVNGIAVDGSGNVVVTGQLSGSIDIGGGPLVSQGGDDVFAAKLDAGGLHIWSKSFGGAEHQAGVAATPAPTRASSAAASPPSWVTPRSTPPLRRSSAS